MVSGQEGQCAECLVREVAAGSSGCWSAASWPAACSSSSSTWPTARLTSPRPATDPWTTREFCSSTQMEFSSGRSSHHKRQVIHCASYHHIIRTVQLDFRPQVSPHSNITGPVTNRLRYFRFWFRFCQNIRIFSLRINRKISLNHFKVYNHNLPFYHKLFLEKALHMLSLPLLCYKLKTPHAYLQVVK